MEDITVDCTAWKPVAVVKELLLYPVKSCAPLKLQEGKTFSSALVDEATGFRDRCYMINSVSGVMVTGRMCPQSVLIETSAGEDGALQLSFPGHGQVTARPTDSLPLLHSTIKGSPVTGQDCGDEVAAWLTKVLKKDVRLLFHDAEATQRPIPKFPVPLPMVDEGRDGVLYSDKMPYLLIGQPSVDAVSKKIAETSEDRNLSPLHFRPNIVVSSLPGESLQPYAEDSWRLIKIGEQSVFRNNLPCTRCIFTTVDPFKGVKDEEGEPMKTLRKERMREGWPSPTLGVMLGMHAPGVVRVGDVVYAQ